MTVLLDAQVHREGPAEPAQLMQLVEKSHQPFNEATGRGDGWQVGEP